jgi:lipopolysaccharide export system protein LptA
MSHSIKPTFLKRTMTVLAIAATAVGSIFYLQEFAKIDPLVNMAKQGATSPDQLGINLGQVHLVQYRGATKVVDANVEKVFIPANRSQYYLDNVSKGTFFSEGKKVNFSAPKVVWNASRRMMTADHTARIWNNDVDLKTALFRINEREQSLYVPGKIEGKLFKGKLVANNFRYDMPTQSAKFGPVEWQGELALNLQDDGPAVRKQWKITSEGGDFSVKNKVKTFTKGTATDFDIIVKADKIVHEEETDLVTATGHVKYFSPKANLSCEKAVIYRKEKRAILTGAVDMLVKAKDKQTKAEVVEIPPFRPVVPREVSEERPDAPPVKDPKQSQADDDVQNAKNLKNYPTAITAEKIEYWYGKGNRHAIITGSPKARQDLPEGRWRHMEAHQALYNGETDFLTLLSREGKADARARTSVGDDIIAEKVVVSTKENDDDLEAKGVKATVFGKSDDDESGVGVKPPDPIKPVKGKGGGGLQGPIGGKKPPGRK